MNFDGICDTTLLENFDLTKTKLYAFFDTAKCIALNKFVKRMMLLVSRRSA